MRRRMTVARPLVALVLMSVGLLLAGCTPPAAGAPECTPATVDGGYTLVSCPAGSVVELSVTSSDGFGLRVLAVDRDSGTLAPVPDWVYLDGNAACTPVLRNDGVADYLDVPCPGNAGVRLDLGSGSVIGFGPAPGGTATLLGVS